MRKSAVAKCGTVTTMPALTPLIELQIMTNEDDELEFDISHDERLEDEDIIEILWIILNQLGE